MDHSQPMPVQGRKQRFGWIAFFSRYFYLMLFFGRIGFAQELFNTSVPSKVFEGPEVLQQFVVAENGDVGLILQQNGVIRAVDFLTQQTLTTWEPLQGEVKAMAISKPGGHASRLVIIATGRVLWSSITDRTGKTGTFHKLWETKGSIYSVAVSPSQDLVAVATSDGFSVLNPVTGVAVFSTTEASCPVVSFAPDGRTLAVGMGKKVLIYRVPSFTQKKAWPIAFSPHTLAFTANSLFLAIGGDRELILIKDGDGKTVKTLKLDASAQDGSVLCFAADSPDLFVSTDRRLVSFTGLDREKPISKTLKLKGRILSMAFSRASEALFAVMEGNQSLNKWDVARSKSVFGASPGGARLGSEPIPPSIILLSPIGAAPVKNGSVQVTFKVSSPFNQPISQVRILVDGKPARFSAGAMAQPTTDQPFEGTVSGTFIDGQEYTYQVACEERDATLLVQVEGQAGTSAPVVIKLQKSEVIQAPPKLNSKVLPPLLTLAMEAHGGVGTHANALNLTADLHVRVHSEPDQPVLLVRVLVDGVPVTLSGAVGSNGRPFNPAMGYSNGETYKFPVSLPRPDSTVVAFAETAYAESEPAVTKLGWKAHVASASPSVKGSEAVATEAPASGDNPSTPEVEAFKPGDEPLTRKADATSDSGAIRILGRTRQDTTVPLEVDAKGRLRWQSPKVEGKAKPTLRQPMASAPVSVQILSPANGSTTKEKIIVLSVKVGAAPGHEITKLQVLVNGAPVDSIPTSSNGVALNGPPTNGQVLRYHLTLPIEDCQVTVLAESATSNSKPATIHLLRGGKATRSAGLLAAKNRMLKPLVTITDPPQDSVVKGKTVRVGVRVSVQPGQAAPTVRLLVDAQDAKADRAPERVGAAPAPNPNADRGGTEEIQYFTVAIPSKDCTVMAYAETPYATSDPALLKLRWDRSGLSTPSTGLPTLYLLAVGVSKYKDKSYSLSYPAKDAKDFAEAMKVQKGKLYKDVVMKVHTDESATRDNIMDDLEWIQRQATQQDMVIVFFAGHGINDTITGNYYFLPQDANMEAVKRTMIPGSEIHSTLARLTGTRLLFLDTCHAGNITGTASRGVPDMRQFLQDLKDGGQGLVVMTSSRPGQKSQEHPSWKNGAFTKALVEGVKGKAQRDKLGFVTFTALDAYITQRVKELTNGTQAPTTQKGTEVSDFPIALVPF